MAAMTRQKTMASSRCGSTRRGVLVRNVFHIPGRWVSPGLPSGKMATGTLVVGLAAIVCITWIQITHPNCHPTNNPVAKLLCRGRRRRSHSPSTLFFLANLFRDPGCPRPHTDHWSDYRVGGGPQEPPLCVGTLPAMCDPELGFVTACRLAGTGSVPGVGVVLR